MTQTSPTMVIANLLERLTALEARVVYLEVENARLQAVISTCRKQERHIFAALRAFFAHQPVSLIAETQVVTNLRSISNTLYSPGCSAGQRQFSEQSLLNLLI